jgi:hypothetical protein
VQTLSRWTSIRLAVFALIILGLGPTPARASLIQLTTILPPPTGAYTLSSPICITPVCLATISVSGFQITSDVFAAGNELVDTNAVFAASVFQNNAGSPGAALGAFSAPGTMDFTFFGRAVAGQLGTFNAELRDFDFLGTFNGHVFEVRKNPTLASTGQTTITQVREGVFQVTSFFDVFAELSIDHGAFVPGPERHAELSAVVPEPGSLGLVVSGLVGLVGVVRRRRRVRQSDAPGRILALGPAAK